MTVLPTGPRERALAAVREHAPLAVLLAAMMVLGIALRAYHLDVPSTLKWDEHHYVETARSYLHHQYAWNDHPPLSKLIIAGFMAVLGDGPLAWRLPSCLFGLIDIGLVGLLACRVFGSCRAAWIAAALVAADGFFIAYSRTALLDGMTIGFALAGMLLVLNGRRAWHAALAGVCVGCAVSFKLNGLVFVAAATAACVASRPLRRWTPLLLLLAALVFYGQCAIALINVGRSGSLASVIHENQEMVRHHLSYTVVHPYSSKWYTWFLPLRPIFLRRDVGEDGAIHALLTLGNPLLWWGGTLAVLVTAVLVFRGGLRRLWQQVFNAEPPARPAPGAPAPRPEERVAPMFWVLAAWAGPIVFWLPSLRDSYVYHYLPSYAFALPLLGGWLDWLYRRNRLLTLIALALVLEVSVLYAPLWGELSISEAALRARLFPGWR
jgi:dolichyl-phosphate-mannose-protein mannosyltransferase